MARPAELNLSLNLKQAQALVLAFQRPGNVQWIFSRAELPASLFLQHQQPEKFLDPQVYRFPSTHRQYARGLKQSPRSQVDFDFHLLKSHHLLMGGSEGHGLTGPPKLISIDRSKCTSALASKRAFLD